jgi:long-subunit fatty acid transport protein
MKKIITALLVTSLSSALFAYSDSDMDGVDDAHDKCPNTPFTDLVDSNGCSKKVLKVKQNNQHYDIIVGANYTGSNFVNTPAADTYSTSLQLDYYYKDFSLQATTSYYKTDDSSGYNDNGFNDSFIGAAYNFYPLQALTLRLGGGALLPTYKTSLNNNNTDYVASLNMSYLLGKWNLFAGYSYTQINDDDVVLDSSTIEYKNTNAYSAGIGYYITNQLYTSVAYNQTESIYKNVDDAKTLSVYAYYSIDKNWFMNFSYAYGLSDTASDNAVSIKLGYYF